VAAQHAFTVAQVDDAIDLLVDSAKDRGQTISYTRVFAAGGLPEPQLLHQGQESHLVTDFMKAVHDRCVQRYLPPLDALVVHVAGRRQNWPGGGYFTVNGLADPMKERASAEELVVGTRFWEHQKEQCKRWGLEARRARI
jgi:hypothetical protein